MFGFLNPRPHPADYRRAYARLCQHQRRTCGLWSLPFHSYEAVFLYQCAVNAGAFSADVMPPVRCCRLSAPTTLNRDADAAVGRFCASVALLLGSIKLEDDIRDTRGLVARLARWILRRRIAKARGYFNRLDPKFARNVEQLLADHHLLEARGGVIPLAEYAEPTALAFGYVFGLMARLPGLGDCRELLSSVGRKLGEAIIAFDCAVDWKRDRRRGEFNPLADESAVADALQQSAECLGDAAELLDRRFGDESRAAKTLLAVRARVLQRNPLADPKPCPVHANGNWLRRTARFVIMPAMVSAGGPPDSSGTGMPAGLPGEIKNEGDEQKPKPRSGGCCNSTDWACCIGVDCCSGVGDCGACDCACA
jgi:hypothetical protein